MKKNRKDQYSLVIHSPKMKRGRKNPELLRITLTDQHTKIDFGYVATDYYHRGGWIRIHQSAVITVRNTKKEYKLLRADNIPITPEQLHFESEKDWQFFSLYFEPLPKEDCVFDLIEEDPGDATDFNYWGVRLEITEGWKIV